MPIDWKPKRTRQGLPLSFRFSQETVFKLKVLAEASNSKQIEILDTLISDAFVNAEKARPKEMASAASRVKKSAKS